MSDEELAALGVSRSKTEYGNALYTIPCAVCGRDAFSHEFSTSKVYRCTLCKGGIAEKRKAKAKIAREQAERELAEDVGVDYEHYHRFEKATEKLGLEYYLDVERARTAIGKFDSMPEVIACVELLHVGARVIVHQKVGDYTVDFCLPDEKVVVEVDGSLYHKDADREFARDNALKHMLGEGWAVRHVPADALVKRHEAFGRNMRKMLNARRGELGLAPLRKPPM